MMRNGSCSSLTSSGQSAATSAGTTTTVLKKGPWTAAEDAILMDYVRRHGEGNWNAVQKNCGLARCGKSCRLRWANHLRPNLKKGSFTPEEEMLILQLHAQLGNKWARMAAQLPGRTDNEIKNFWNTRIKRRQRAGLPLYPNEIHQQQQQQQRRVTQRPLNLPSATSPAAMPLLFSPEDQRMKGMWISTPATGVSNTFQYSYNGSGGNYNGTTNSPLMMPTYSPATVRTGLPSSQLFNAGGGENGCRLLDAMLEETQGGEDSMQRKMVMAEPVGAARDFGGNGNGGGDGDDRDFFGESFPKFEDNGESPFDV